MLRRALVASTTVALVMASASPSSAVVTADFSGDVFDDGANDSYAVRCSSGTMRAGTSDSISFPGPHT